MRLMLMWLVWLLLVDVVVDCWWCWCCWWCCCCWWWWWWWWWCENNNVCRRFVAGLEKADENEFNIITNDNCDNSMLRAERLPWEAISYQTQSYMRFACSVLLFSERCVLVYDCDRWGKTRLALAPYLLDSCRGSLSCFGGLQLQPLWSGINTISNDLRYCGK